MIPTNRTATQTFKFLSTLPSYYYNNNSQTILTQIFNSNNNSTFISHNRQINNRHDNCSTYRIQRALHVSTLVFAFSTKKQSPNRKPHTPPPPASKQQKHRKKMRQLQQQQIKQLNREVNLTKGTYNPLMDYLILNKHVIFWIWGFIISVVIFIQLKRTLGVREVQSVKDNEDKQIGKKKKFVLISETYEKENIGNYINKLYQSYFDIIQLQQVTPSLAKRIRHIQYTLAHYENINQSLPFNIQVISSQQPILVQLPKNNIFISNSLLRSSLTTQQLTYLLLLSYQLFSQGHHLRNLSWSQVFTFWRSGTTNSDIKLRQVYARNYTQQQIKQSIMIANQKIMSDQKLKQNQLTDKEIQNLFQKLKTINAQIINNGQISAPENIVSRLQKYSPTQSDSAQ